MYVEYLRVSGGRGRARAGDLSLSSGRGRGAAAGGSRTVRARGAGIGRPPAFSSRSRFVSRVARAPLKTIRVAPAVALRPARDPSKGAAAGSARGDRPSRRLSAPEPRDSLDFFFFLPSPDFLGACGGWASCGTRAVARRRARRPKSFGAILDATAACFDAAARLGLLLGGSFRHFECVGVCVFGAEEPRPVLEVLKL